MAEPTPAQNLGNITEPSPPKDPRVAFGGFVKPEMYDVFGEHDYESLSDAEKLWVYPSRIAPYLFDAPVDAEMAVRYTARGGHNGSLALPSAEFNWIVRYPRALGRSSIAGALSDHDLSDERIAASERARVHVFQKKLVTMEEHTAKLVERRQEINRLKNRIHAAGYAHEKASNMKQLISGVWQEGITILDVLHVQRGWNDAQRARAETALAFYLTSGAQPTKISHWKEFSGLTESYLAARSGLFKDRIRVVKAQLGE